MPIAVNKFKFFDGPLSDYYIDTIVSSTTEGAEILVSLVISVAAGSVYARFAQDELAGRSIRR